MTRNQLHALPMVLKELSRFGRIEVACINLEHSHCAYNSLLSLKQVLFSVKETVLNQNVFDQFIESKG